MELTFDEKVVGKAVVIKLVTEKDIETIMVNGIEGGIGYWACLLNDRPEFDTKPKSEPSSMWATHLLVTGQSVWFSDDEGVTWELTLPKLIKGIEMNATERTWDTDLEQGDAITYDCIIQYALFGKVVYG